MKRWCLFLVFLGLLFLAIANPCFAGSIVCKPPTLQSYVIITPSDVAFKFNGTCNVDNGGSVAYNASYYIEAHWQKPIAQEYIKVSYLGNNPSQIFTSHCQKNPWLTDGGPCPIDPFNQHETTVPQFFALGPDSKIPISWNAIPPDKKTQINIEIAQMEAKSATTQKPVPKQPPRILMPVNNQGYFGPPTTIQFRILHDVNWPVKYEFKINTKVGNGQVWTPQNVSVQHQKSVGATDNDGVTPVKITSGEATLDKQGEWQLHTWYDCPGSNLSSSAVFTVQSVNPNMMPHKTVPPGMIKLK